MAAQERYFQSLEEEGKVEADDVLPHSSSVEDDTREEDGSGAASAVPRWHSKESTPAASSSKEGETLPLVTQCSG